MADKQISQLTAGTIGNNADSFMFDDADGYTYKLPYSDLAGAVLSQSLGAGTGIDITTDSQSEIYKRVISVDADATPTQNSQKPVTSGGVYDALSTKQDELIFDNTPIQSSDNPVTSDGIYTALAGKQDTLTFDNTPTQNSNNPVTSGGVYAAIQGGGGGGGSYSRTLIYDDELQQDPERNVIFTQSASNFDEIEIEYWEYQDEGDHGVIPFSTKISNYYLSTAPSVYVGEYNTLVTLVGTAGHYSTYDVSSSGLYYNSANTGDTKVVPIRVYGINY